MDLRIALLPSTQWKNPVLGGGTEAQYAHEVCRLLKPLLEKYGHEAMIFSAAQSAGEWTNSKDANSAGAREAAIWKPDLCLSIHSDAGYAPNDRCSALICYQEPTRINLATRLLDAYCQRTGYRSRGIEKRTPGINGVAVLRIPEENGIPALLLERGWHDREPDATNIRTRSSWFAECIAGALIDIFGAAKAPKEKEVEPVRLELDRKEGDKLVYEFALPLQPDDLLAIDADIPAHDVEVIIFAKPVVGEILNTKTRIGGYGNRDNVHGTLVYLKQLFPSLQGAAWVTVHSPVPLHGGVMG